MKIDIRGLKKLSSDDQSTTFRTSKGHKFIVDHNAMKPGERKFLSAIPHYAEGTPDAPVGTQQGGGWEKLKSDFLGSSPELESIKSAASQFVPDNPTAGAQFASQYNSPNSTPQTPVQTSPITAAAPNPASPTAAVDSSQSPQAAPDQTNASQQAAQAQPSAVNRAPADVAPQAEQPSPDSNGAESAPQVETPQAAQDDNQNNYQKGYADYQKEHAQRFGAEDAAFAQDLKNGHITPETYQSLFAKKDTLGKIGTLFGVLVGGMGSGLTHQKNAVIAGMDQQIQNDLEAQKQSKSNAQNYIRLNQQQQLNNSEIGLRKQQGQLTDAQSKNLQQQMHINATTFSQMQANRAGLAHMVQIANGLPPGSPQWQSAQDKLAMISSAVDGQNYSLGDTAAAKLAFLNMGMRGMRGMAGGGSGQQDGPVNYQKMNQLERMSQMKMPGAPSTEDLSAMTKEASSLEESRALRDDFNNAFSSLDNKFLAGKLSPNDRDSYINSLSGKLAKASAGRYNEAEAKNQINSMIPQAGDWGNTRADKTHNNNSFFDILEAGTPTLNRFGAKNAPKSLPQTPQYKTVGGVKYMRGPNGEAIRVK